MIKVARWMADHPSEGIIFILLCICVGLGYGWKRSADYGDEMYSDVRDCNFRYSQMQERSLSDYENLSNQNLREKDSIINMLEEKINDINNLIDKNQSTIKTVKRKI